MRNLIIAIIILGTWSCSEPKQSFLIGNWQAITLLEDGQPVNAELHVVRFHFDQNHQYQFFGTLNYKEAGTYYLDSKYLYTTDTLNQATTEKAVEIVNLTPDSLVIKMNDSGRERVMKLTKIP